MLTRVVSLCELSPEVNGVQVKFTAEIAPGSLDIADPDVIKLLAVDPENPQCQVSVGITWRVYQKWLNTRQSYLSKGKLLRFTGMADDEDGMMVVRLLDDGALISPAARP